MFQSPPELTGFDPDNRVDLGVESLVAAEYGNGYRISLDAVRSSGKRFPDDVAQEATAPGRSSKVLGCADILEMTKDFLIGHLRTRCRASFRSGNTKAGVPVKHW